LTEKASPTQGSLRLHTDQKKKTGFRTTGEELSKRTGLVKITSGAGRDTGGKFYPGEKGV